jgi:hypothetical protein
MLKRVKSSMLLSRDDAQGMTVGDDARRRDGRGIAAAWSGKGDANRDAGVVRGGAKLNDSTAAVGSGPLAVTAPVYERTIAA